MTQPAAAPVRPTLGGQADARRSLLSRPLLKHESASASSPRHGGNYGDHLVVDRRGNAVKESTKTVVLSHAKSIEDDMGIQSLLDRDGDSVMASYAEVKDDATGLVVRGLWFRSEYAGYRTPFREAHLEIEVEQLSGVPDAKGVTPRTYTVRFMRMAELAVREPCRKWPVPESDIPEAGQLAIRAVELFASNLVFDGPVRTIVSLAPKYHR